MSIAKHHINIYIIFSSIELVDMVEILILKFALDNQSITQTDKKLS